MTIDLSSFDSPETFTIKLPGGTEVSCVPVTLRDERVLERAHPSPRPPLNKQPPGKGSAAPKIANPDDPGYIKEFGLWYDRQALARVAISLGYTPKDGTKWCNAHTDQAVLAWIDAINDELGERITAAWIGRFIEILESKSLGGLGELVDEAGLGNSGTPSGQQPTGAHTDNTP